MNQIAWHALGELARQAGDETLAARLEETGTKAGSTTLYLAFCGHFSAGKSTLLNRLSGEQALPTGPIPVSANTVLMRNGAKRALLYRQASGQKSDSERNEMGTLPIEVPFDRVGDYCIDGGVDRVELTFPMPRWGDAVAFLDTPGIDSTDEAHREATVAALHLADVVFYVTDYNHVLSEWNIQFTKRLTDEGKPFYFLINQVDKHREEEIAFAAFREKVERSLKDAGSRPEGLLFLSLKREDHPLHEGERLFELIGQLAENREAWSAWSARQSADSLIAGHVRNREAAEEAEDGELAEAAGWLPKRESLSERIETLQAEERRIRSRPDERLREWKQAADSLMANANLVPAETRELARLYLESREPGFRRGLFRGSAATEKEREARREAWRKAFRENVQVQLQGHLDKLLRQAAEEAGLPDEEARAITAELAAAGDALTADWLAERVQPGAVYSPEYALVYARQAADAARAEFRRRAHDRLARAATQAGAGDARELAGIAPRLSSARQLAARIEARRADAAQLAAAAHAAGGGAERPAPPPAARQSALAAAAPASAAASGAPEPERSPAAERPAASPPGPAQAAGGFAPRGRHAAAAAALAEAARLASGVPGLAASAEQLRAKADRLAASRATVALFGAFSAGKSSLAGALIGERLLPVSPNPTTAAINRIAPPDAEHPHGTVTVRVKPSAYLLEEVNGSLARLDLPGGDWEACLRTIAASEERFRGHTAKSHAAFLRAVRDGYPLMAERLGTEYRIPFEEFPAFVAEERLACYIEWLELAHGNPFTERGAVLVDTPGADSVNGRHTGVAFDYMKNADAILFVTYYNHAFSQADREFLMQLGRVKDSLELDHMFFLVNAVDLAGSAEEERQVLAHVEANLGKLGIRRPRLYPVSSREALDAKLRRDETALSGSGFARFERDFTSYLEQELAGQTRKAAARDLERVRTALEQRIRQAEASEEERAREEERLKREGADLLRTMAELVRDPRADQAAEALRKEVQEQFYYIRQRFEYRFGELYQACFNPASLRPDGSEDIRSALRSAWLEWTALVSRSLSQEALAATLRLERAVRLLRADVWRPVLGTLTASFADFAELPEEEPHDPTPPVEESIPFADLPVRLLHGHFKSSKHFFEGGGSEALREALAEATRAEIARYLERHRDAMADYYGALLQAGLADASERLQERFRRYLEERESLPSGREAAAEWRRAADRLRSLQAELDTEEKALNPADPAKIDLAH
ncbi:dynamin family protein [Gorillibacterium sp. sgz500922]|uniref:dynamin family protein n=1 Tax=Gorillibacterium sp. sgz500922 TaxID=3446694 RepID=UPI003F669E26